MPHYSEDTSDTSSSYGKPLRIIHFGVDSAGIKMIWKSKKLFNQTGFLCTVELTVFKNPKKILSSHCSRGVGFPKPDRVLILWFNLSSRNKTNNWRSVWIAHRFESLGCVVIMSISQVRGEHDAFTNLSQYQIYLNLCVYEYLCLYFCNLAECLTSLPTATLGVPLPLHVWKLPGA